MTDLINPTPHIFEVEEIKREGGDVDDEDTPEPIDKLDIYNLIRNVKDPEHPNSLEQLKVLSLNRVDFTPEKREVVVWITPTVTHCSAATLIGLCVRVQLLRTLPQRFKVDLRIFPGSHDQEEQVNKQLNDKERIAAALENPNLLTTINACLTD
eukprot:TRINITY_DN35553_c0_g1_i1.p2 TRINITY_DN35553_c0_g1~~TRINITY_DN35553_c0_g1_i1.p2  ORF type:complete len:179 (+),score=78.04 TRINITY_DN35553_c0_g1_i1:77-538(+)